MYYGYAPTGTTGYLMNSRNPNDRIAGQNLAYAHATSDRGLANESRTVRGMTLKLLAWECWENKTCWAWAC